MIKKVIRNPWLIFSPFLLFYSHAIKINKWPVLYGDEIRYVEFAHHLIHGFYSPSAPNINLWNGPGYPIILWPFIAYKVPVLYITLLNALFLYLAVVFLYKTLSLITNYTLATICCLLLAIYPNYLAILPILYTEAFTCLLMSIFIYTLGFSYVKGNNKYNVLAGLIFGYLILTKIIFGYVVCICLLICLAGLLFNRNKPAYQKPVLILLTAFMISTPYLGYTWWLTGKPFYWSNAGGMSLYWMSTPFENEFGDWKTPDLKNNQYPSLFQSAEAVSILRKNHAKEINFILKHNEMKQDELFKQIAIKNIKAHPLKFISNYGNNFSRMLFNFPYSYAYQDGNTLRNIVTGSLILWVSVVGIVLTWINRRKIIFPVKLVLLITAVYLLLSGALSAYPRQLDIMMPVLLFWIAYLIANIKKPGLKFAETENLDYVLAGLAGDRAYAGDVKKDRQ